MQSFNAATCRQLRSDLEALLAKYGAENNLTFSVGNMKFSAGEAVMPKFTARVNGVKTATDHALEAQMSMHKLKAVNHLGDELQEYNWRRPKYPFVYKCKRDGKRYKCGLDQVKRLGFNADSLLG